MLGLTSRSRTAGIAARITVSGFLIAAFDVTGQEPIWSNIDSTLGVSNARAEESPRFLRVHRDRFYRLRIELSWNQPGPSSSIYQI